MADPSVVPPYRWWALDLNQPTEFTIPRYYVRIYLPAIAVICACLALPAVTSATGVSSLAVAAVCGVHVAWVTFATFVIAPAAARSAGWLHVAHAGSLAVACVLCALLAVLSGRPDTLLWTALCVYTAMNGALPNFGPSLVLLLAPPVAALITIPIFLLRGADPVWAIGGPTVIAGMVAMTYHGIAMRTAGWRAECAAIEAQRTDLRRCVAELERTHLARDLHDAVGSPLTLAALYGELVERHAEEPEVLRRIAGNLRGEARQGLGDLRGVIDALAPDVADLAHLAEVLRELGRRITAASNMIIDVDLAGAGAEPLDTGVRLAMVRVFQEALHNALRHGRAERVGVSLTYDRRTVTVEIVDDGAGFDPDVQRSGRGLPGLAARIEELGGVFELESARGRGTRIQASVPLAPSAP